jgi:hypothetical protein
MIKRLEDLFDEGEKEAGICMAVFLHLAQEPFGVSASDVRRTLGDLMTHEEVIATLKANHCQEADYLITREGSLAGPFNDMVSKVVHAKNIIIEFLMSRGYDSTRINALVSDISYLEAEMMRIHAQVEGTDNSNERQALMLAKAQVETLKRDEAGLAKIYEDFEIADHPYKETRYTMSPRMSAMFWDKHRIGADTIGAVDGLVAQWMRDNPGEYDFQLGDPPTKEALDIAPPYPPGYEGLADPWEFDDPTTEQQIAN